jgi:hypothetical protein
MRTPRAASGEAFLRGFELCECSESVIVGGLSLIPVTFLRAIPRPPACHVVALAKMEVLAKKDARCAAPDFCSMKITKELRLLLAANSCGMAGV